MTEFKVAFSHDSVCENVACVNQKYIVSRSGEVYRITQYGLHRQKPRIHTNGYLRCTICGQDVCIHRLVAFCFLENPHGYTEINHKDGNKQNNRVDNLEWCDRSYNNRHAFQTGLRSYKTLSVIARKPKRNLRKFDPDTVRKIWELISLGHSDREIAKVVHGSHGSIYQIRTGKTYREA